MSVKTDLKLVSRHRFSVLFSRVFERLELFAAYHEWVLYIKSTTDILVEDILH
jgi:hypothetical protein